jgi:hypothetical protein
MRRARSRLFAGRSALSFLARMRTRRPLSRRWADDIGCLRREACGRPDLRGGGRFARCFREAASVLGARSFGVQRILRSPPLRAAGPAGRTMPKRLPVCGRRVCHRQVRATRRRKARRCMPYGRMLRRRALHGGEVRRTPGGRRRLQERSRVPGRLPKVRWRSRRVRKAMQRALTSASCDSSPRIAVFYQG